MSLLFWLDYAAYVIATVIATALGLMVLVTKPKCVLNHLFALFALAEAAWAVSSLLLRMTLWLQAGNPALILELATLFFALAGPFLLMFTVRYVDSRARWADLAAALGLASLIPLSISLFRHQIIFNPHWIPGHASPYHEVNTWGIVVATLPVAYIVWSLILLWRTRRQTHEPYPAMGVLILLVGFALGGLIQPRSPIMPVATTVGVMILSHGILNRQLLNPLRELNARLERKVEERTRELEAERNFVSTVLNTVGALVFVVDSEGRIVRFNRACEQTTGYSFDEVEGKYLWDLCLTPEDADVGRASVAAARVGLENPQRGDFPRECESYWVTKDGSRRLIAWSSSSLPDDAGSVAYIIGTGIDITERARIEAVRAQAEAQLERYADVANNMQLGLQIYHLEDPTDDRTLRLITTNPAAAQFTGLLPEETLGKTIDEIFPRLRERGIPQAYADVVRTGLPVELEQEVYYGPGNISDAWLSVKAFPLPGDCVGILSEDITLRKQAEESLRKNKTRYQAILEDQTELICRMLPDGTLTFVNEATCGYFGQKHEDLIGKSYILPIFEEDRPKVREHIAALTAENPVATYEHRVIGSDGETRWLQWTARAIFDEQGRRDEVQSVGRDITERKRAMQALRESEERFRTLFDGIPACCWTFDRDGTILDWNRTCEKLYGWTAEQAVGKTMYDLMVKDENVVATRETVAAVFQGQFFEALEYEDVRADGTTCNVLANEYPLKDSQGRVIMGVCAELDITERVRAEAIRAKAEESLRRSKERFREMAELLPEIVFELDEHGVITFINRQASKITGYTLEDTGKRTEATKFFIPADRERVRQNIVKIMHGELSGRIEYTVQRKDGSTFPVVTHTAPIIHEGKPVGVRGILFDITKHKREEALLRVQRDSAVLLNSTGDPATVLDRLLEAVLQVSGIDCGGAYLVNRSDGSLDLVAHKCISGQFAQVISHLDADTQTAGLILAGEPAYRRVPESLPRAMGEIFRREGIRALAVIPVQYEGQVIATLQLGSHTHDEIPLDIRHVLEAIGAQIGGFIARTEAESALRESEQRYRSLFEDSPISLWEEDFSGAMAYLHELQASGVEDLRAYLMDHPQAVAHCGALVEVVDVNKATLEMYKARSKDELRNGLGTVLGEESYHAFVEELAALAQGQTRFETEGINYTLAGEKMPIAVTLQVAPGYEDTLSKVLISIIDMTERELAKEALEKRATQLALINNVGQQIVAVSNLDSMLRRTVWLVQESFGYYNIFLLTVDHKRGEVVDMTSAGAYTALFPDGYRQKLSEGIIGWVARHGETLLINDVSADPRYVAPLPGSDQIVTQSELTVPIRVGEETVGVLDVQSPRFGAFDENDVMILETLTDQIAVAIENARLYGVLQQELAERKRAEKRLEQYAAELEQSNREIKQFAYIVSHDLRAPLVNLKGFAAELRAALAVIGSATIESLPHLDEKQQRNVTLALQEDVPEALEFIESSVSRMDTFINAVLKLSRLGRRELRPEPIDTQALVQANLETLAHQIEGGGVQVTVGPLPEVVADRTSMEQIWGNLLGNAVKYLDPDRPGEIEITAERADVGPDARPMSAASDSDETTFHVRDNGRGIAADDMDKVFAPFRRAGRQDVPGEGMGLAYVQTLVRRHGGRIWCESEPGVGTSFSFTIPNQPAKGNSHV